MNKKIEIIQDLLIVSLITKLLLAQDILFQNGFGPSATDHSKGIGMDFMQNITDHHKSSYDSINGVDLALKYGLNGILWASPCNVKWKDNNQEHWKLIGPPGGRVAALTINPKQPEILYAGTETGILFRSFDGGETSEAILDSTGFMYFSSSHIYFNPVNPDIIFAGNYCSIDGGDSWTKINGIGSSLAFNEINPDKMYSSVSGKKVMMTEDSGNSWQLVYEFAKYLDQIAISKSDTNILYAGGDDSVYGVYRSINSGVSWQRTNFPTDISDIKNIVIHPNDAKCVYAGTSSGLYKTTDAGQSWNQISCFGSYENGIIDLTV